MKSWGLLGRLAGSASRTVLTARIKRKVMPHTLPRSMAPEILNRGVREEVLSTLLGHASTETTRASYARLTIKTMGDEVEQALATGARGGATASREPS